MSTKIIDFNKGLDEIELIDKQIETMLESENYSLIIDLMKERLSVISQLTKIREKEGITEAMKLRLDKIFHSGDGIQKKVQIKKQKVADRLKEGQKIKTQNKRMAY